MGFDIWSDFFWSAHPVESNIYVDSTALYKTSLLSSYLIRKARAVTEGAYMQKSILKIGILTKKEHVTLFWVCQDAC